MTQTARGPAVRTDYSDIRTKASQTWHVVQNQRGAFMLQMLLCVTDFLVCHSTAFFIQHERAHASIDGAAFSGVSCLVELSANASVVSTTLRLVWLSVIYRREQRYCRGDVSSLLRHCVWLAVKQFSPVCLHHDCHDRRIETCLRDSRSGPTGSLRHHDAGRAAPCCRRLAGRVVTLFRVPQPSCRGHTAIIVHFFCLFGRRLGAHRPFLHRGMKTIERCECAEKVHHCRHFLIPSSLATDVGASQPAYGLSGYDAFHFHGMV